MNIAILAISSFSLVASVTTLVIMYKTKKGLEQFGESLSGEIDNVKTTTNGALSGIRTALNEVVL